MTFTQKDIDRLFRPNEIKYINVDMLRCNCPIKWNYQEPEDLDYNAISFNKYMALPNVSISQKILHWLIKFQKSKNVKNIKISYKEIYDDLIKSGNDVSFDTIGRSLLRLAEGHVDNSGKIKGCWIRIVQTGQKRKEAYALGATDRDRVTRVIQINWEKINELSSIFDINSKEFKELPPISRERKFVKKRAVSAYKRKNRKEEFISYLKTVTCKNWDVSETMKYLKDKRGKSKKKGISLVDKKITRVSIIDGYYVNSNTGEVIDDIAALKKALVLIPYNNLKKIQKAVIRLKAAMRNKQSEAIINFQKSIFKNPLLTK